MSAAYKEAAPRTGPEPPGQQVPGVEMRLSQVSDVSGVSSREGGSADLPPAPAASPHLKDTEQPGRERCSAAPPPSGPELAPYLLGADPEP